MAASVAVDLPRDTKGHLEPEARQIAQETLLRRISNGETVSQVCRELGISKSMAYEWSEMDPEFAARYARARVNQAHALADETLDIAAQADKDNYNALRLQVDTRKWFTAKIAPKLYGDRLETNVTVTVTSLHLTALADAEPVQVIEAHQPTQLSTPDSDTDPDCE